MLIQNKKGKYFSYIIPLLVAIPLLFLIAVALNNGKLGFAFLIFSPLTAIMLLWIWFEYNELSINSEGIIIINPLRKNRFIHYKEMKTIEIHRQLTMPMNYGTHFIVVVLCDKEDIGRYLNKRLLIPLNFYYLNDMERIFEEIMKHQSELERFNVECKFI